MTGWRTIKMPTTDIIFSYAVLGGGALIVYLILNLDKDRIEKSAKKIKKKKKRK